ncbi:MAG: glycosyltransferase [Gemmatimonadales bacterium]
MTTRVVHVASGREWRGGQRQVWLLARELAKAGVTAQVVVTAAGSELARRLTSSGIRVREVPWRAGIAPRAFPAVLAEIHQRPAILHAHDPHALTIAGVCAVLARRPLVVTRRVVFRLRRPGFWRRADRVVAISRAVADVLALDGIDPARVTVVHSGISIDELKSVTPLQVRRVLGLPDTATLAVNVASLVGEKDHVTLLRAAQQLAGRVPELHWVIAGTGPLLPELERLCAELSLTGRVHFVGQLDEPARLIAEADVFVMSSREEGLGTTVLEAMALGIPVASTAAGGLPEMLGEGAGRLVSPGDAKALAEAVERLLRDPGGRAAVVARASEVVLRFTAARMADQMASVYRSCVPFP